MKQQRIALHARQLVVIVSHEFYVVRATGRLSQCNDLLEDGVQADRAPGEPPGSGEDQQIPDDFGGAVRLAIDRRDLPAQLLRKGPGHPQQLQMAEHPLQRIVQFVGDPGHELAERGELLRLRQPLAELLALRLEPALRRQVARDDDAADAVVIVVEQIGDRDHERPVQHRIDDLADRRRLPVAPHALLAELGEPAGELGSDALGQRPVEQLVARRSSGGWRTPRWRGRSARACPRRRPGARSSRTCSRARAAI